MDNREAAVDAARDTGLATHARERASVQRARVRAMAKQRCRQSGRACPSKCDAGRERNSTAGDRHGAKQEN
jgi:hypothetical protein